MDLYYFRHYSELSEAAKEKTPKEMSIPVKALLIVSCTLAAPFMMVAGLICVIGFGINGAIHSAISKEKAYDEITKDEFIETISEIEDIQKQLIQMQKRSKYYNLVYRYHKVDGFIDVDATKHTNINIRDQFMKGKSIVPLLSIVYYCTDGIAEYKNLLKSFPNQDIPFNEGENENYLSDIENNIAQEMDRHLSTIGYTEQEKANGKFHEKYPHCNLSVKSSGDGMWIWIERRGRTRVKLAESDT